MHVTDHKCADILLRSGPITAGELAEQTGLTTGAITGVIDRLGVGFRAAGQGPERPPAGGDRAAPRADREQAWAVVRVACAGDGRAVCPVQHRDLAVIRDFVAASRRSFTSRFRGCGMGAATRSWRRDLRRRLSPSGTQRPIPIVSRRRSCPRRCDRLAVSGRHDRNDFSGRRAVQILTANRILIVPGAGRVLRCHRGTPGRSAAAVHQKNGHLVLSPTDLGNHLGCSHATVLDLRQLTEPPWPHTFSETDRAAGAEGRGTRGRSFTIAARSGQGNRGDTARIVRRPRPPDRRCAPPRRGRDLPGGTGRRQMGGAGRLPGEDGPAVRPGA